MIVDIFAGPGGWDTGLALLGIHDVLGIEWDREACATARAAGHRRQQLDVAEVTADELARMAPDVDGLIASPPCQAWSRAGGRGGLEDVDRILEHLAAVEAAGEWIDYRDRSETVVDLFGVPAVDTSTWADPRSGLVLEPVRYALALRPRWIACEQVPDVLPFWQRFAAMLDGLGYATWAGVLSAEQYGVPQTRKRAILVASLDGPVSPPAPTHAAWSPRGVEVVDGLLPPVSMAQALGWGMTARPYPTIASGRTTGGPDKEKVGGSQARELIYAERDAGRWTLRPSVSDEGSRKSQPRALDEPAHTITGRHRSAEWTMHAGGQGCDERVGVRPRPVDEPAPTITGKGTGAWVHERPATTVQGDPRIWPPGHKVNADDEARLGADEAAARYGDRAGREAIRVAVDEAATLQSFPYGYPWRGSSTAKYRQVGDAVPPLLAVAVVGNLLGVDGWRDVCRDTYRATGGAVA